MRICIAFTLSLIAFAHANNSCVAEIGDFHPSVASNPLAQAVASDGYLEEELDVENCDQCNARGCDSRDIMMTRWAKRRWISSCDMPQHLPYEADWNGYYYFRPYHYAHIGSQQETAQIWGKNPKNPYDNRFFQAIYDSLDVETIPTPEPEELSSQNTFDPPVPDDVADSPFFEELDDKEEMNDDPFE